jgi:hypothetical protein
VSLAKIAHSFTVAEVGLGNFLPLLPNFIFGDFYKWRFHYIGGHSGLEPPSGALHEISIEPITAENWPYLVVRLRLFANLGSPTYRIVAGEWLSASKPAEVLLAEAGIGHAGTKICAAFPTVHPVPKGLWGQANSICP